MTYSIFHCPVALRWVYNEWTLPTHPSHFHTAAVKGVKQNNRAPKCQKTLLKREILQVSNIYKKEAGSKIMPVMAKDSYVHTHCHLMVTWLNNEGTPAIQWENSFRDVPFWRYITYVHGMALNILTEIINLVYLNPSFH